jgi:hypothetical protein
MDGVLKPIDNKSIQLIGQLGGDGFLLNAVKKDIELIPPIGDGENGPKSSKGDDNKPALYRTGLK